MDIRYLKYRTSEILKFDIERILWYLKNFYGIIMKKSIKQWHEGENLSMDCLRHVYASKLKRIFIIILVSPLHWVVFQYLMSYFSLDDYVWKINKKFDISSIFEQYIFYSYENVLFVWRRAFWENWYGSNNVLFAWSRYFWEIEWVEICKDLSQVKRLILWTSSYMVVGDVSVSLCRFENNPKK